MTRPHRTILDVQLVDDSEGCEADADVEYSTEQGGGRVSVHLRSAYFRCTKCRRLKGASHFGLRRMGNGIIRNQSQCKPCRSTKRGAR